MHNTTDTTFGGRFPNFRRTTPLQSAHVEDTSEDISDGDGQSRHDSFTSWSTSSGRSLMDHLQFSAPWQKVFITFGAAFGTLNSTPYVARKNVFAVPFSVCLWIIEYLQMFALLINAPLALLYASPGSSAANWLTVLSRLLFFGESLNHNYVDMIVRLFLFGSLLVIELVLTLLIQRQHQNRSPISRTLLSFLFILVSSGRSIITLPAMFAFFQMMNCTMTSNPLDSVLMDWAGNTLAQTGNAIHCVSSVQLLYICFAITFFVGMLIVRFAEAFIVSFGFAKLEYSLLDLSLPYLIQPVTVGEKFVCGSILYFSFNQFFFSTFSLIVSLTVWMVVLYFCPYKWRAGQRVSLYSRAALISASLASFDFSSYSFGMILLSASFLVALSELLLRKRIHYLKKKCASSTLSNEGSRYSSKVWNSESSEANQPSSPSFSPTDDVECASTSTASNDEDIHRPLIPLRWYEMSALVYWISSGSIHSQRSGASDTLEHCKTLIETIMQQEGCSPWTKLSACEFFLTVSSVRSSLFGMISVQEALKTTADSLEQNSMLFKVFWASLDDARRSLDQSGSSELMLLLKKTNRHRIQALQLVAAFWELLLIDNVPLKQLPAAVSRIESEEIAARNLLGSLLQRFPSSPTVLRAYAQFLRDLDPLSFDEARYYIALADRHEGENGDMLRKKRRDTRFKMASEATGALELSALPAAPRMQTGGSAEGSDALSMKSDVSNGASDVASAVGLRSSSSTPKAIRMKPRKKRVQVGELVEPETMDTEMDVGKGSVAFDSVSEGNADPDSASSAAEIAEDMKSLLVKKPKSLYHISFAMFVSLLCLLAICITVYVIGKSTIRSDKGDMVANAGGTRMPSVNAAYMTALCEAVAKGWYTGTSFSASITKLTQTATDIETAASSLFASTFGVDSLIAEWQKRDVPFYLWSASTQDHTVVMQSRWEMYNSYVRSIRNVASFNATFFSSNVWTGNNTDFRSIVENGPYSLLTGMWSLVYAYVAYYRDSAAQDRITLWVLAALAVGLPILLILLLYVRAMRSILRERKAISRLFLLVPKTDVSTIVQKCRTAIHAGNGKKGSSADILLRGAAASSTSATTRVTLIFLTFIIVICSLIIVMCGFCLAASFSSYSKSAQINYAGSRRSFSQRINYLATELIRDDARLLNGGRASMRPQLSAGIQQLSEIHDAVKYGSAKFETPPSVGHSAAQDSLLFDRRCNDTLNVACLGLDGIMSAYLNLANVLLLLPDSQLTFQLQTYRDLLNIESLYLGPLLTQSKAIFVSETPSTVTFALSSIGPVFGVCVGVIAVALVVSQFLQAHLWKEIHQYRKMLTMIPVPVVEKVPALESFVRTHGTRMSENMFQDAVEEAELRTRSVLAASVDGILELNSKGFVEHASPSANQIFRCSENGNVIGRSFDTLVCNLRSFSDNFPYDIPKALDEAVRKKGTLSLRADGMLPDQQTFPVQLSLSSYKIKDEIFYAAFVRDLTVGEKTELLLRTERQRSDDLLLNILPRSIATRLKDGEHPIYDQYQCVSLCFVDIVKFTELSSHMTPRDLVEMLSDIFSNIDILCTKHKIEKIKLIGDCFFGAAGLFERKHDHAVAMISFLKDVIDMVKQYNLQHSTSIEIRAGVNSGPVIGAVIGKSKFVYDCIGDAVNIASRMESSGVPGRIQITRSTYELVWSSVDCEERGDVDIKGKGKMQTFLVK
eukprot:ANDGO_07856.mRNA.1 Adenylate cyclase